MADTASLRVSVVISCYNYGAYVGQAIESALGQDHPAFEIIVVDDGSSDDSPAVIARYADRVQIISQSNTGQIIATNRAFARTRGEIVMFLDADDLLTPDAISTVLAHWRPGCVKTQCELDIIDAQGEPLGRRFCNYGAGYDGAAIQREFRQFGSYQWPVTTGNAYARAYVERLMPLTAKGPDGPLNTVAPLYGDIVVIHRVLGFYRLHGNNQSNHGTSSASLGVRFSRQVDLRLGEIAYLRQHAALQGAALPQGNLLDQDLFMVNYRLMLQKLGEPYQGGDQESARSVWQAGMRLLATRAMPLSRKLVHAAWLTGLALSPRPLARGLVRLRFQRAELFRALRGGRAKAPRAPSSST
jgi:hypothetical protein